MEPKAPKSPADGRRHVFWARTAAKQKYVGRELFQFMGVYFAGLGAVVCTGYGIYHTGYMLYNKYSRK